MVKTYNNPSLGSRLILSDEVVDLHPYQEEELFKIIWNQSGLLSFYLDDIKFSLEKDELICLTSLQQPEFTELSEDYYILIFNREFYCIHENDHEVSCEGLLFWGSSDMPVLQLNDSEKEKFESLFQVFLDEMDTNDKIQGEMLRMLLKRLIIKATRLARKQQFPEDMSGTQTELIRQFNILVEQHYKENHQVKSYARMLHKSPKTLSNVFAAAGHKTPIEVIHNRILVEGKRQLLKTDKTTSEITYELGFQEQSHFSRFFKNKTGVSPTEYRKKKGEI